MVDGAITATDRRLDRLERRVDDLAVEYVKLERQRVEDHAVNTTRLNSVDAKLAYISTEVEKLSSWSDELKGALKLPLRLAALSPLVIVAVTVWRIASTGQP